MAIESTLARLKNYFIGWHKANYQVLHQMTDKIEPEIIPVSSKAVYTELGIKNKECNKNDYESSFGKDACTKIKTGSVWGHIMSIWANIYKILADIGEKRSYGDTVYYNTGEAHLVAAQSSIQEGLSYFFSMIGREHRYTKPYIDSSKGNAASNKNPDYNSLVRTTIWGNLSSLWNEIGKKRSYGDTAYYNTGEAHLVAAQNSIQEGLSYFLSMIGREHKYTKPYIDSSKGNAVSNKNPDYNSLVKTTIWGNFNSLWDSIGDAKDFSTTPFPKETSKITNKKIWNVLDYIRAWLKKHWIVVDRTHDGYITKEKYIRLLDRDRQVLYWDLSVLDTKSSLYNKLANSNASYNDKITHKDYNTYSEKLEKVVIYKWGQWGMIKFNNFELTKATKYTAVTGGMVLGGRQDVSKNSTETRTFHRVKQSGTSRTTILLQINSNHSHLKNFTPAVRAFGSTYLDEIDWMAMYKINSTIERKEKAPYAADKALHFEPGYYGVGARFRVAEPIFNGTIIYPINTDPDGYYSLMSEIV